MLFASAQFAYTAKIARVFVDSEASLRYNENKESEQGAKYETYVFIKGNFYPGDFKDKSLIEVQLDDVFKTVGESMKARNYYPSGSPDSGDLLIVVHYGTTSVPIDLEDLFAIDPNDPSTGELTEVFEDFQRLDVLARENRPIQYGIMNNETLGIGKALGRRKLNAAEEFDLRVELEDERYFIILMAYDYLKLRETGEKELLWTTRFSLPAIGTNFKDAYPALARAASAHYGTSLEKYAKTRTHLGTGSVDIGTLETVGVEDEDQADSK